MTTQPAPGADPERDLAYPEWYTGADIQTERDQIAEAMGDAPAAAFAEADIGPELWLELAGTPGRTAHRGASGYFWTKAM
jgi:hypothetical protein